MSACGASLRDRLNFFSSAFVGTVASVGGAALLIIHSSVYIQSDMSIDADESGDCGGAVPVGGGGGGGGGGRPSGESGGGGGIPAWRRGSGEGDNENRGGFKRKYMGGGGGET